MTLLDFQPVLGRHNIRPPHFASKVSYSASPQTSAKCPRDAPCSDATFAMLFAPKPRKDFYEFYPPPYLNKITESRLAARLAQSSGMNFH